MQVFYSPGRYTEESDIICLHQFHGHSAQIGEITLNVYPWLCGEKDELVASKFHWFNSAEGVVRMSKTLTGSLRLRHRLNARCTLI